MNETTVKGLSDKHLEFLKKVQLFRIYLDNLAYYYDLTLFGLNNFQWMRSASFSKLNGLIYYYYYDHVLNPTNEKALDDFQWLPLFFGFLYCFLMMWYLCLLVFIVYPEEIFGFIDYLFPDIYDRWMLFYIKLFKVYYKIRYIILGEIWPQFLSLPSSLHINLNAFISHYFPNIPRKFINDYNHYSLPYDDLFYYYLPSDLYDLYVKLKKFISYYLSGDFYIKLNNKIGQYLTNFIKK